MCCPVFIQENVQGPDRSSRIPLSWGLNWPKVEINGHFIGVLNVSLVNDGGIKALWYVIDSLASETVPLSAVEIHPIRARKKLWHAQNSAQDSFIQLGQAFQPHKKTFAQAFSFIEEDQPAEKWLFNDSSDFILRAKGHVPFAGHVLLSLETIAPKMDKWEFVLAHFLDTCHVFSWCHNTLRPATLNWPTCSPD